MDNKTILNAIIIMLVLCLLFGRKNKIGEFFDTTADRKNLCTVVPTLFHTKDVGKFIYELKGKNILANVRTFQATDGAYHLKPGIFRFDVDFNKFIGGDHTRLNFVFSTYDSYYKNNIPSSKLRFVYADGDASSSLFSLANKNDAYPWAQMTNTILSISADNDNMYEISLNIDGKPIWTSTVDKNNILICE